MPPRNEFCFEVLFEWSDRWGRTQTNVQPVPEFCYCFIWFGVLKWAEIFCIFNIWKPGPSMCHSRNTLKKFFFFFVRGNMQNGYFWPRVSSQFLHCTSTKKLEKNRHIPVCLWHEKCDTVAGTIIDIQVSPIFSNTLLFPLTLVCFYLFLSLVHYISDLLAQHQKCINYIKLRDIIFD